MESKWNIEAFTSFSLYLNKGQKEGFTYLTVICTHVFLGR